MDERLRKFSFTEAQLRALDEAIVGMLVLDVHEHMDDTPSARFDALKIRVGILGADAPRLGPRPDAESLDAATQTIQRRLAPVLGEMTPLQCVLMLFELRTLNAYARMLDPATTKLEVATEARETAVMLAISRMAQLERVTTIADIPELLATSQEDAERAHSTFWRSAAKIVGIGAAAVAVGIFAGPIVGGLVGTYLLGLSGAAAVSAGLALLGGGAMAAGGFGMVGGSVVLATAFGAAGVGASSMFLGKNGDAAARLAYVKHQAAFACLIRMGIMDHELASEFLGACETELSHYTKLASGKSESAKESAKVADVIRNAFEWMRNEYAAATRDQRIKREPIAWSPKAPVASKVADPDMKALFEDAAATVKTLKQCVWLLRNAHRSYNEFSNDEAMKSIFALLDRDARQRLVDGNTFLLAAVREITELAASRQQHLADLVETCTKVASLEHALERQQQVISRYRHVTLVLHQRVNELAKEREELLPQSARLRTAAATAIFRDVTLQAAKLGALPKLGAGAPTVESAPNDATGTDIITRAQLALLLGYDEEQVRAQLGERASHLRSRAELERVVESFGVPLGASADAVRTRRTQLLAEVHPDKFEGMPSGVRDALRTAGENHQIAYALHQAYAALGGSNAGATT